MKKILIIHTEYTQTGGEDIAVRKEIEFLSKYYRLETLIFENTLNLNLKEINALIINKNKESVKKLILKIKEFKPDYVYIHNLWFRASLGILEYLLKNGHNVSLKLHNFRYDCTKSFFSSVHLQKENICNACGLEKNKVGVINKYYEDSFIKSLLVNNFGRKYFKMLKSNDLKILTMTNHHKQHLINLGVNKKNIFVQPNPIEKKDIDFVNKMKRKNQIVYAGRISKEKGLEELIDTWESLEVKDFKLIIIGEGPLYENLKKNDLGSIEIIGYKENNEVLKIINESKAVVTATKLFEGQPTLLCEASALSVPAIFPDSGGIKDFFPPDNRFKFQQYNYFELGEKLQDVIDSDDIEYQGLENQKFIYDYLSEENLIDSLNSILESK